MMTAFRKCFLCAAVGLSLFSLSSCGPGLDESKAKGMVTEALKLMVDKPSSVRILKISGLDSVFGNNFLNDQEKTEIVQLMMHTNKRIIGDAKTIEEVDFSDAARSALMERQIEATDKLRSLLFRQDRSDHKFSGWKMKVEFEAKDGDGKPYHSEYWFILDPQTKYVLHSFEIPLL